MFFSDQIACPKSLQLFGHLVPGTRRAFPEHIRPASRDVSNDARSGNANRYVLVRYLLVQIAYPKSLSTFWASGRPIRHLYFKRTLRTSQTNNQHQSSDMTASTRGVNLAVTKQLSDTIFSSQCMQNRHCKGSANFISSG